MSLIASSSRFAEVPRQSFGKEVSPLSVPEQSDTNCVRSGGRPACRDIAWDLGELLVGFSLILVVLWTPRPLQYSLYFIALGWFVVSITLSFESWKAMGCCLAGFWRSSWIVGVAVVLSGMATYFAGAFHTLHHPGEPLQWFITFGGYTIWALLQQLLLQGYFLARTLRLIPNPYWAALLTATVFALVHLPNPVLTPLTLIWGLAACLVFIRSGNVYPIAIAHAIFGICVAITVPASILHNMRVGLGYLDYQSSPAHLSQNDRSVSTNGVRAEATKLR